MALAVIFFYFHNLNQVDYDDIKQTLYIVDIKSQTETEVPVEKINKIYLSSFGGRGNSSYVIVYSDFHNEQQKVRLFPILFDNSINVIKAEVLKNPNVVIRNWAFGWNELFNKESGVKSKAATNNALADMAGRRINSQLFVR